MSPIPSSKFSLREMQPSDSPAVAGLITEFDGDMTTRFLIDAYTAIVYGTDFYTEGVIVECENYAGLVGMGTVRFGKVQYNGSVFPIAFLDGLKVHKDFRGQGLGYQIAHWRVQRARELYGDECVIATGMLQDNHASQAVARKWCREFIEPAIEALIQPVRRQAPKPIKGITVREIEPQDYEEFSARQNAYYKDYNFYPPIDASSILSTLAVSPEGKKPYHFFVAVDDLGNLVAGVKTWSRGLLKSDHLNNVPLPLRLLNRAAHFLPPDFIMRDISAGEFWSLPGRIEAAKYLWEMMRFKCSELGTTVAAALDPRDPIREVINLKPWNQPRPKITMAINGPAPIQRQNLLFGFGRV